LTFFHLDGLSHARVAEALSMPVSTVRSLVTRARRKLQPLLASYATELLPVLEDVLEEQKIRRPAMLHITDGESVAGTLREAAIPGKVSVYGDLMYERPAPSGLTAEAWRDARARFMAKAGYATLEEARKYLKNCDDALSVFSQHEEVVVWLDYRLTDQLILMKVLDWFSRQHRGGVKMSLICAGSYSGIDNFVGLGELTADQLTSLTDTRVRVADVQFHLAQTAWAAFTSPEPTAIEDFLKTDTSALPFIAMAFRRHLEQFPSVDGGLSRTEHQALSILREQGSLTGERLFDAVQSMEEQIFMGNWSFYRIMAEMSASRHPLIQISARSFAGIGEVTITEAGRNVIDGRADNIKLNGINRWVGGVHLEGDDAAWRWDRNLTSLVEKESF
jgi:Sigma-70, region 4